MRFPIWALGVAVILSACGGPGGETQIERLESGVLFRNDGPELNTVDPHLANGSWTQPITGDLFVGLLRTDATGEPGPALAERWSVSEDGLTWTFYMREAVWSDGKPITADDVVFSLRRAVNPATAAVYVEVYSPFVNAAAILRGEADPETLGVTAIDPLTVEIQLEQPMPFLPDLMADSRSAVVPQHAIEAHGSEWVAPENIVVNGAYTLVERVLNSQTVLRRNPLFFDDASTCFEEVFNFPMALSDTAVRRARAGELDIAADVPAAQLDQVNADLPGHVQIAAPPATFFLITNTQAEPFTDVRVREALGISINRPFAFEEVIRAGTSVTDSLVPASLVEPVGPARVRWADEPLEDRRTRAVALLAEAGFGPENPFNVTFSYPTAAVSDRVAPVLQQDWNSLAEWVNVEILGTESAIHYQSLGVAEFEVALSGWVAVIRDASYMMDVVREGAAGNFAQWSNDEVETLLAEAQYEQDLIERARLFQQAEQIALDDFAVTPFYTLERSWIIHPRIEGWIGGPIEYTPSTLLCLSDAAP